MWSVDNIISMADIVLSVITLIVTTYIGVWIVTELQSKSESSRALREYVVDNVIKVHDSFQTIFIEINNNEQLRPHALKARINAYTQQLSNILLLSKNRYNVEGKELEKNVRLFYKEVEESPSFQSHYKDNKFVVFQENEHVRFGEIEANLERLFPKLINDIYEA